MRRPVCPEGQEHIFPQDVMATLIGGDHRAPRPILPLPVAQDDEIDTSRVCKILGVKLKAVHSLVDGGAILCMRRHQRSYRRVSYRSLLAFCDALRLEYAIPDQRKPRRGISGRFPDHELLPFPLADTIDIPAAAEVLRYSQQTVRKLCEDGRLVAYKLHHGASWRISREALRRHRDNIASNAGYETRRSRVIA